MTNVFENSQKLDVEEPREKSLKSDLITKDLTVINGIGPSTVLKLTKANINSIKQLADFTPKELSLISGVKIKMAEKFIVEARNHLSEYDYEPFDVAEIFIDEKLLQEESDEKPESIKDSQQQDENMFDIQHSEFDDEEVKLETTQEKWFEDKFDYSRLSASYPPISENQSKEPEAVIEEVQERPQEQMENIFNEEFLMVEKPLSIEEDSRENIPLIPETDGSKNVESFSEILNPRVGSEEIENKVEESLKLSGYYIIPNTISALNSFMENIDYIGSKLVRVSKWVNHIFIVPIKLWDHEETVLVNESQLKSHRNEFKNRLRQDHRKLLYIKGVIFDDIVNDDKFREFFQKYLQVNLLLEKSVENKKLFFVSGQTQYKIIIEPILVCKTPPRCMEKSISFPYQRHTNIHVIYQSDLTALLGFLEQKYQLIESRVKSTNKIKDYQTRSNKFRTNVRIASIPLIGYAIALAIIYFAEFFSLLRLFNSIGFAIIGVYFILLVYLYLKFYRTKKELTVEFETPYYMQNLEFSEIDLLEFKDQFSTEYMVQFGYECFGKDKNFKILEQIEKENFLNCVDGKKDQTNPQFTVIPGDKIEDNLSFESSKYNNKYISFLDD